ncbi:MAG: hypothetical protein AB2823_04715 [Candidatus Thiodiazotropha endolucinida]
MTGRQAILGGSVLMLAAANIWYWWPGDNGQKDINYGASQIRTETVSLDDLHALEILPISNNQVKRDLFLPVVTTMKAMHEVPEEIEPVISKVDESSSVIKNNIRHSDHLVHYRLAGIVFKNGVRVAYLLDGETPLVAHAGDNLSRSVTVESIGTQTAIIKDTQTGLTRKLVLVGE